MFNDYVFTDKTKTNLYLNLIQSCNDSKIDILVIS